jgi:hypothetical protein
MVVVHGKESPSDADWDRMCEFLKQAASPEMRILVYTDGGAPSAVQRSKLNAVLHMKPRVAILTTSLIARTAGTALRWFNDKIRIFGPHEIEAGLKHLQLTRTEETALRAALDDVRGELRWGKAEHAG